MHQSDLGILSPVQFAWRALPCVCAGAPYLHWAHAAEYRRFSLSMIHSLVSDVDWHPGVCISMCMCVHGGVGVSGGACLNLSRYFAFSELREAHYIHLVIKHSVCKYKTTHGDLLKCTNTYIFITWTYTHCKTHIQMQVYSSWLSVPLDGVIM